MIIHLDRTITSFLLQTILSQPITYNFVHTKCEPIKKYVKNTYFSGKNPIYVDYYGATNNFFPSQIIIKDNKPYVFISLGYNQCKETNKIACASVLIAPRIWRQNWVYTGEQGDSISNPFICGNKFVIAAVNKEKTLTVKQYKFEFKKDQEKIEYDTDLIAIPYIISGIKNTDVDVFLLNQFCIILEPQEKIILCDLVTQKTKVFAISKHTRIIATKDIFLFFELDVGCASEISPQKYLLQLNGHKIQDFAQNIKVNIETDENMCDAYLCILDGVYGVFILNGENFDICLCPEIRDTPNSY